MEKETIREVGLRATSSRIEVLKLLSHSTRPLTHAEVVDALSAHPWDQATIYRNLIDLSEVGLLRRISLSEGIRFESVYQHHSERPVHFVCSQCEIVQCLHWSIRAPKQTEFPKSIQAGHFEIQVRGVCDQCATAA